MKGCSKQFKVACIFFARACRQRCFRMLLTVACYTAAPLPRSVMTCQSYFCLSSAEPCLLHVAVQARRRAGLGARAQPSQTRQLLATREGGKIGWSLRTATVSLWDCLNMNSRSG